MADRGDRSKKKSQFELNRLGKKAIMTSSASRRFRAEDDNDELNRDIGSNVGGNRDPEELQKQKEEADAQAQAEHELFILETVPPEYQAQARAYLRRKESLLRRKLRQKADEASVEGAREYSDYVREDPQAKRAHQVLREAINPRPNNPYLARGGSTFQSLRRDPGVNDPRLTAPLDEQILGEGQRSVAPDQLDDVAEGIADALAKDARQAAKEDREPELDLEEILKQFSGEKQAELRPRILQQVKQKYSDADISSFESRVERKLPREKVVFRGKDRQRATTLANLHAELVQRRLNLRDEEKGSPRAKRIEEDLAKVEKALSEVHPDAIVDGEPRTAEETEAIARKTIADALDTVPDPLGRPRSGWAAIARQNPEEAEQARETHSGIYNEPIPRKPGEYPEIEAYVQAVVDSYHAPLHKQRVAAQRRAEHLAQHISSQVGSVVEKRREEAARKEILDEMRSKGLLPSPPAAPEYKDTSKSIPLDITKNRRLPADIRIQELMAQGKSNDDIAEAVGLPVDIVKQHRARVRQPDPYYKDPRVNPLTAEDIYEVYGGERIAPRWQWEKKRLASKITGEPLLDRKPAPFEAVVQQGRFLRDQTKTRLTAFKEGTTVIGVNDKGQQVPYNQKGMPKARIGMMPNVEYVYHTRDTSQDSLKVARAEARYQDLLHESKADPKFNTKPEKVRELKQARRDLTNLGKTVVLPPTDQKTMFDQGRRNRFGQLKQNETNELLMAPETRPMQKASIGWEQGARSLKGHIGPDRSTVADEVRYVPTIGMGVNTKSLTAKDPSGRMKARYLISVRGGPEREISGAEYREHQRDVRAAARENDTLPITLREVPVPRMIEYRYVDPKYLELNSKEVDKAVVRMPHMGPLGERLLPAQFTDDATQRLNVFPGRAIQAHMNIRRAVAADKIVNPPPNPNVNPALQARLPEYLQNKYGIRDKNEAQIIVDAAIAAGLYNRRRKFQEESLPFIGNTIVKGLRKTSPKVDKAITNHLGDVLFGADEAYGRPARDKIGNLPFMLTHPFSDPNGVVMGVDVSSIKNRQELIGPDKLAQRAFEREKNFLDKVEFTANLAEKHKAERGPIGAYTRWKLAAVRRSPDYSLTGTGSRLRRIEDMANEAVTSGTYTYQRRKTGKEDTAIFGDRGRQAALELRSRYHDVARHLETTDPFAKVAREPGFVSRGLAHAGTERNLMIGGAVVGTALGAAYLYHRHQEHKKPPEERTAFYNKALPPAFNVRVPHAQITRTVKFGDEPWATELGFKGKEVPVEFGFGLQNKRIALRPSDRGYDKNLPLFGRPSLKGAPGGSIKLGAFYNPENKSPKRKRVRSATHTVSVAGHQLPGYLNLGKLNEVKKSSSNPKRMTTEDIENVIWAHSNPEDEAHVQAFYRGMGGRQGERIIDTWTDSEEATRIRRRKDLKTSEGRARQRRAIQAYSGR